MMDGRGVDHPLHILQVSPADVAGGAEKVAWNLFRAYRARGHHSWLAVGRRHFPDPDVFPFPDPDGAWFQFWRWAHRRLQAPGESVQGARLLGRLARRLAEPGRFLDERLGREDFHFPGSRALLQIAPEHPDIVHCHNLHDAYFDLRTLRWLSQQVPVVLTLHDAWLLSGHCAHSFGCERWKAGCGRCPDLAVYPAIRRDATASNWRRKQRIYARSRLFVATPCQWLMRKVEQSMLNPALVEGRVIPYGLDLSLFHPGDRRGARAALKLPGEAAVLLFIAHRIRSNPWKDYDTLRRAVLRVSERLPCQGIVFVALGEEAPAEQIGQAEVRFVRFEKDHAKVAAFYQAADVYLHAARADTFPNTVLEALACGVPVVATAVGGIPEQVKGLGATARCAGEPAWGPGSATGILVPSADAEAMAEAILTLLTDSELRLRLGENAARDAAVRFDLQTQVERYLSWYAEILKRHGRKDGATPKTASTGTLEHTG